MASVAAGGRLAWLPEPLVAAAGCHHLATARVTLAEGAHLVWRDELVCGRYGESPGDVTVALAVTYGGRPLYHQELAVGPTSPGWDGPAVLAGARATGSLLLVEPAWLTGQPPPECHGPEAVTMPLAGPAVVTTAATADAATLRAHLNAVASASAAAKSAQPA